MYVDLTTILQRQRCYFLRMLVIKESCHTTSIDGYLNGPKNIYIYTNLDKFYDDEWVEVERGVWGWFRDRCWQHQGNEKRMSLKYNLYNSFSFFRYNFFLRNLFFLEKIFWSIKYEKIRIPNTPKVKSFFFRFLVEIEEITKILYN